MTNKAQNQKEKIILKMWRINGEKIPVLFLPEDKVNHGNIAGFDREGYSEFDQCVYWHECNNPTPEQIETLFKPLLHKYVNWASFGYTIIDSKVYPGYTIVKRDSHKMRVNRWAR